MTTLNKIVQSKPYYLSNLMEYHETTLLPYFVWSF